jgi:uncharacterized protein YjbI with pentapeptide repeats
MARAVQKPLAPRLTPPDLPARPADGPPLAPSGDWDALRWQGLDGTVDAAHGVFSGCVFEEASVDRLDLVDASLTDVAFTGVRATEVAARGSRWRAVRITGGRIGTLDLGDAQLDGVEFRGVRIDYVSLASATAADVVFRGCDIRTLDLPLAKVERIAFEDTRIDEVDSRGLRCRDLDLRGLDALSYTDVTALRGATMSERQAIVLAPVLAAALGIDLRD